jgi:hypothetical protein
MMSLEFKASLQYFVVGIEENDGHPFSTLFIHFSSYS